MSRYMIFRGDIIRQTTDLQAASRDPAIKLSYHNLNQAAIKYVGLAINLFKARALTELAAVLHYFSPPGCKFAKAS